MGAGEKVGGTVDTGLSNTNTSNEATSVDGTNVAVVSNKDNKSPETAELRSSPKTIGHVLKPTRALAQSQAYAKTCQAWMGLRANQRLPIGMSWMVHTLIVSLPHCPSDDLRNPLSPTTAEKLTVLAMDVHRVDSRHLLKTL